jgi:hypothetical protein
MKIDQKTLSARSWAIPAISGLLILHHDFKTPRLSRVSRLTWREGAVDVHLQYGVCNISGNVMSSSDIVVRIRKDGVIELGAPAQSTTEPDDALMTFLAGEISREAARWKEDMASWMEEESLEGDKASILSMVSAVVAHPLSSIELNVEKDVGNPGCLRKIRMLGEFITVDVMAAGFHGVSLYVKGSGPYANILRLSQEPDMRDSAAMVKHPAFRFLKGASFRARKLMYLPLGMVLYFCERLPVPEAEPSDTEDFLEAAIVDASSGCGLSALTS